MTHSYVGHDSFVCDVMMLLIHIFIHADARPLLVCHLVMCDLTHSVWLDAFCVTWLCCSFIYSLICYSHVGHDSFICGTWLIHMWDMTHSYMRHDSFICGTWPIHMLDMTHSYVMWWCCSLIFCSFIQAHLILLPTYMWHDTFICGTWLIHMSHSTSYL